MYGQITRTSKTTKKIISFEYEFFQKENKEFELLNVSKNIKFSSYIILQV